MKPGPKPKPDHKKAKTRTFVMRDEMFHYINYMALKWKTNRSRALVKVVNFYKANGGEKQ